MSIRSVLALSLAGALIVSACGDDDDPADEAIAVSPAINVGRTTDPVSQLVAEMYSQGLENSGYRVGRKDPVADRAATMAALEEARVQLVPEFSSGLLAQLAADGGAGSDATAIDEQMIAIREQLPASLTAFEPAAVDNRTVIACNAAAIEEHTLATISDLADAEITLGGTAAFAAAAGGLAALNTAYATELTVTEVPDVAAALVDGSVDCGALPELTPSIVVDALIVLEDDKSFAAADMLVPVMTLEAGLPDVQAVLDAINASLTTDVMRSLLLVKIEVGEQSYDVIAKQFLASVSAQQ